MLSSTARRDVQTRSRRLSSFSSPAKARSGTQDRGAVGKGFNGQGRDARKGQPSIPVGEYGPLYEGLRARGETGIYCVSVSSSPNPLGSWHRLSVSSSVFSPLAKACLSNSSLASLFLAPLPHSQPYSPRSARRGLLCRFKSVTGGLNLGVGVSTEPEARVPAYSRSPPQPRQAPEPGQPPVFC